jgi:hypothetical protein
MQRPATPPPSPLVETVERRELRKMALLNYRTGMALVRQAQEMMRLLDAQDSTGRHGRISGNPKEGNDG